MFPINSAVVVGGSLSGLLTGLHLKRSGIAVTILEQDPNEERSSHNAGIQMSSSINELLKLHDDTGARPTVETSALQVSLGKRQNIYRRTGMPTRWWTNWGLLYRLLRANFDAYPSKACPDPPAARETDGEARYLTGKKVTGLRYAGGAVTVSFEDRDGNQDSLQADLVVGADGARSSIRTLVNAPRAQEGQYTGYVAWRGAVARKLVSKETADYFLNHASFDFMGGKMYILCYVIPTDHGSFDSDDLLLNWLIYQNLPCPSAAENEIFTDRTGVRRQTTVPQGQLDPSVWAKHRDVLTARLTPPFAEIVAKSPSPFVTKVFDGLGSQASFHDGHVVLVGDALTAYRPNVGRATDMAATQLLGLAEVWKGSKPLEEWDGEACRAAKTVLLQSRVVSEMGRGTWFSFFGAVVASIWWGLQCKFGRPTV